MIFESPALAASDAPLPRKYCAPQRLSRSLLGNEVPTREKERLSQSFSRSLLKSWALAGVSALSYVARIGISLFRHCS